MKLITRIIWYYGPVSVMPLIDAVKSFDPIYQFSGHEGTPMREFPWNLYISDYVIAALI